jgi:drug/metabolite transporter (DMT)-like permease
MTDQTAGFLFASITAMMWGFLAIALKAALNFTDVGTIVGIRFLIAFVCLFFYILTRNRKQLAILKRPPLLGVLAGICLAGNYVGFMTGVSYTTPVNSQILIQSGPLLLAVAGIVVFKEKMNAIQKMGVVLFLVGLGIFYQDQLANFSETATEHIKGDLYIIFGAITWTAWGVFHKFIDGKWAPQQINLLVYGIATVLLFPLIDLSAPFKWTFNQWLLILFLGANTLIAYGTLAEAIQRIPVNQVSFIITLNPLITILVMEILLKMNFNFITHERISVFGYIGAMVLISGVAIVVSQRTAKAN